MSAQIERRQVILNILTSKVLHELIMEISECRQDKLDIVTLNDWIFLTLYTVLLDNSHAVHYRRLIIKYFNL